jgi:NifB/MoaA-like Fe-S oxidoreductase
VVTERLSPLYVSIHATDPEVRTRMLRNRRGATSLRWLRALLDAGIDVHGQIVVCPGINDGAVLDDTLCGVLDRFPELASVAAVPLGVSRFSDEAAMRAHTRAEAHAVVTTIERWQRTFSDALGRRMVFAADEYYLLADAPFPEADAYEGFPQHENGVGMAAALAASFAGGPSHPHKSGFFAAVDGAPPSGYRARRAALSATRRGPAAVLTGVYGAAVLAPLLPSTARIVPVENQFFGGNIAVTGLMVGADLARVLAEQPEDDRYLLPDVCLSNGMFLDGMRPADLPRPVEIIPTTGAALQAALAA